MAQNRLYLRCGKCGNEIAIAKLGSADYEWWSWANQQWAESFAEWIETHAHKCGEPGLRVGLTGESREFLEIQHPVPYPIHES